MGRGASGDTGQNWRTPNLLDGDIHQDAAPRGAFAGGVSPGPVCRVGWAARGGKSSVTAAIRAGQPPSPTRHTTTPLPPKCEPKWFHTN